ncbi:MAG: hypothetical protein JW722_03045 [Demequinaceae bacterium]|nr:hypothetical protein [Demequinaceae bacterium]
MEVENKPNWVVGILAAIGAGLIGGIAYAAVMAYTENEIGYLAIVIGLLVGFALVKFGKVSNIAAGIVAAVLALVIWFFSIEVGTAWYAATEGWGFFDFLKEELKNTDELIRVYFEEDVKSYLFAALAAVPAFWIAGGLRNRN